METQDTTAKKKRIIIIAAAVLVIATALILFFYYRSKITATTMRILRLEGTVSLEDDGQSKTVRENLRLNSGNALSTAQQSLVSIGLDDVKIVTLDELSRAEFNQSGRKLDLSLTSGSLFFEVQKPLEDDESFDIKTSTMVVGIRGTSGWVSVEGDHESIIITDGHVHIIGTNPVTGEKKEIDVYAGQKVSTYLYNDRKVDSIMFYVEKVTERDLPEFLLDRLRENPALLDKVCKETGWDKPWILGKVSPASTPAPVPTEQKSHDSDSDDDEPTPPPTDKEPVPESTETTGTKGFSKAELDRARGMIIAIDASTGIVALADGTLFDPVWYAEAYPEVVAKYGNSIEVLIAQYVKAGKKEGKLPLRPVTPKPEPTPTWVSQNNDNSDDDDDDDDDGNNQGQQNQQQINVAYGPDANGNYDVTLENGTARLTNYGGNLEIIGTDSNGRVKIPFEIKDTNGQHLAGGFDGGYVKFRTNNVQYIDATEYDHPSMFGGTIDEAKKAGNDVFTISNGTTTVNVDTNSSNAPTANITPGAKGASNLKDALNHSIPSYPNSFSDVNYGNVSINYSQNTYTVTDSSTSNSFTFNKNTSYINTDNNNNVVITDWGGNVLGTIKPDGTIQ